MELRCTNASARTDEARSLAWLAGDRDIEFPPGTYLMAQRFGVRVAPAFN